MDIFPIGNLFCMLNMKYIIMDKNLISNVPLQFMSQLKHLQFIYQFTNQFLLASFSLTLRKVYQIVV